MRKFPTYRKLLAVFTFLAIVIVLYAVAQQPQFVYSQVYTAALADQGYATTNGGAVFWKLTWAPTSASACTVAVDSSPDGTTWTAGGVIPTQTCTSSGNTGIINVNAAFVRINLTAFTGTKVKVTLTGYSTNPAGGSITSPKFFATGQGQGSAIGPSATANTVICRGVVIPYAITVSNVMFTIVTTADNTAATYDIGLVATDKTTVLAHTGAIAGTTFAPATGARAIALVGAPISLAAQNAYLCYTTSQTVTPATFGGTIGTPTWFASSGTVTAGGTLAGIAGIGADNPQVTTVPSVGFY